MNIPKHDDACWQSDDWRKKTLIDLMETHGLKAAEVGKVLGQSENTIFCWRTVTDRSVPKSALKVLMFEISRGAFL
jgi:hypothetical protein